MAYMAHTTEFYNGTFIGIQSIKFHDPNQESVLTVKLMEICITCHRLVYWDYQLPPPFAHCFSPTVIMVPSLECLQNLLPVHH